VRLFDLADPMPYEAPRQQGVDSLHPPLSNILLIWVATIAISLLRIRVTSCSACLVLQLLAGGGDTAASSWSGVGQSGSCRSDTLQSVGVLLVAVPALHYSRVRPIAPRQAFLKTLLERS